MLLSAYKESLGIRNKSLPLSPILLAKFSKRACIKKAYKMKLNKENFTKTIIKDIESHTLAYLAGFTDGEGSISYNNYEHISFRIANSDLDVLTWFKDIIGTGRIKQKPPRPCYTMAHYSFTISRSIDVYILLNKLLPFLKIKQHKAQKAIKLLQTRFPYFK